MNLVSTLKFIQDNGPTISEGVLAVLGGLKVLFHYLPEKYENPSDRVLDALAIPFRWLLAILQSNDNGPKGSESKPE